MSSQSLFDKIWQAHVIGDLGEGWALLHVDRHLLHELAGPTALEDLAARDLPVLEPDLLFATPDHGMSSRPGRTGDTYAPGARFWHALRQGAAQHGFRLFDLGRPGQGIVHVMGPELGIVLPGTTVICTDSHTCTNGGMGALPFGVGSGQSAHALATQTLRLRKPASMRVRIEGQLGQGVTAKDLALHLIGRLGAASGVGHVVEFAGEAVRALSMEERLTLCNLTVELGARSGLIAPDDKTVEYLRGRPYAPQGDAFDRAAEAWLALASDQDANFDREEVFDAADVAPSITWGTSPEHVIPVTGEVPVPAGNDALVAALDYMGLTAGAPIAGTKVDWVFIGSCANSRITDLRAAASVVRGRQKADGVTAWVVPGSENVKRAAEAEGLDRVFLDAGFEWREPGCSMCVAANGERVPPGARSVSTSNRNFVGRQGPGARTHLASPAMAAAAAVTGMICDVRSLPDA